jgi:hypothetical protein
VPGPRGPRSCDQDDQPDGARDVCIRLLVALGANSFGQAAETARPVLLRVIRKQFCNADAQMARVPQLVNEGVVGMAFTWRQHKPHDNA